MNKDSELLNAFLTHLIVERGLAKSTESAYRYQLNNYLSCLASLKKNLRWATNATIRSILAHRRKAGITSSTFFIFILAIRQFHRYLAEFHPGFTDPTAGVKLPKVKQKLPNPLTIPEMDKLLTATVGNKFTDFRNVALFEVAYSSGLRASELVDLKLDQINFEEGWIRVHNGKGGKERVVPVGPKAIESLRIYLEARESRFSQAKGHVFLNSRGKPLNRGGFWWLVKKRARRMGFEGRITPHLFRHSCATHLLAGGASLRAIQELLGHADISTTQIYTHVDLKFLKESCERAHPRY